MRALAQRVSSASVTVDEELVGRIGRGLCTFVGVTHSDTIADAERLARKLWGLRIFEDDAGLTNLSAEELGLQVLLVSQFTLYADTSRGRRPSFAQAAPPQQAEPLVDQTARALRELGAGVETGVFGTAMRVTIVNDGPFTVLIET